MKQMKMKCVVTGLLAGAVLMFQAAAAMALPILLSQGLPSTSYSASGYNLQPVPPFPYTPGTNTPDKAFDLSTLATRWLSAANATLAAPQWIEVDLGMQYDLSSVILTLATSNSTVAGGTPVNATFDIYASNSPMQGNIVGATLLSAISNINNATVPPSSSGPAFTNLEVFTQNISGVFLAQYVQVRTVAEYTYNGATTAYVRPSWRDISVYGEQVVPEPSTFILLGAGLGGLALLRRRRA